MTSTIPGLEGYLPSIKVHNYIIEENEEKISITLELSAIDSIDKRGSLFWGKDFDFSRYIKYSIILNTNANNDQRIHSILYNSETRIQKMYEDLRTNDLQGETQELVTSTMAEREEILKELTPKTMVDKFCAGRDSDSDLRSNYYYSIFPLEVNKGIDNFFTDSRSSNMSKINMKRFTTVDLEGRQIVEIPAVKTLEISKSDRNAFQAFDTGYLSCYIFSILDLEQLARDNNFNLFSLSFADTIGSTLTYDLILSNGVANNEGFVMEYTDQETGEIKPWYGAYHEHTAEDGGNYRGFMGGTKTNHRSDILLRKRRVENVKVVDRRGLNFAGLEHLDYTNPFSDDEPEPESYSLISGTDAVYSIIMPQIADLDHRLASKKFKDYYKEVEMRKYSQGNSVVYGKMFLDQTETNCVNYIFMIDFKEIYMQNARYARLNKYVGARDGQSDTTALQEMRALSLKLYRKKVSNKTTGISGLGHPEHENVYQQDEIPYLVAEITQRSDGSFTRQVSSSEVRDNADNPNFFSRKGTMREIEVRASEVSSRNQYIKTFTGTDFSTINSSGATYQYYVEIDFYDNSHDFYIEKYSQLLTDIRYLEDLYNRSYQAYDPRGRRNDVDSEIIQSMRRNYAPSFPDRARSFINGGILGVVGRVNDVLQILYPTNNIRGTFRPVRDSRIDDEDEMIRDDRSYSEIRSKVRLFSGNLMKNLLNPLSQASSPENHLLFISFLNDLKASYGKLIDIDSIPSHKYKSSATTAGNDTNMTRFFTVTNEFPEYITPDNTRSNFNLAYFGDIFQSPGVTYGIPIIDVDALRERLAFSMDRFRANNRSSQVDKVILEPLFFNSFITAPQETNQGFIFHRERQNSLVKAFSGGLDLGTEDMKNIVSAMYQSGMFGDSKQYGKPAAKRVSISDLRLASSRAFRADVKKIQSTFEQVYRESVKEFSQELGITLFTDNIPLPTSTVGDIVRAGSPINFLNSLGAEADLKSQKLFFKDKILERVESALSRRVGRGSQELIERITKLMESLMTTDHDRYYTDSGIMTEEQFISDIKAKQATARVQINGPKLPIQIDRYVSDGRLFDGVAERYQFAPQSRLIYDSFKEIKMFHNLNIGDNISTRQEMEDFASVTEANLLSSVENDEFILLSLEQYTNEDFGIGFSEISKAPIATKYVLLKGSI